MSKEVKPRNTRMHIVATMGQQMHHSTRQRAIEKHMGLVRKKLQDPKSMERIKKLLKARKGGLFGLGLTLAGMGSSIKEAQKK